MLIQLPGTYKAVVFDRIGGPFVFKDLELQMPGPDEVLVKVLAAGICSTDAHISQYGFLGAEKPTPLVMGHELVGDVVAVGGRVTIHSIGDRVGGGWHGGHDGTCRACQKGVFQMCATAATNGVSRDGGFAEYCVMRAEGAVNLPLDTDPVEAVPMLCAGVTVFNGLRRQNIMHGELVTVQGLGALGHLAVQFTKKMGYDVVIISSGESKREFASQLGASGYINSTLEDPASKLQSIGGAAAIVSTAPNSAAVGGLVNGLQELGTLLVLAPLPDVQLDLTPIVLRGLKVAGWPVGHSMDVLDTVRFAKRHGVKAIVEKYKFAAFQAAFDRMMSGRALFKVVLGMQ